MKILYCWRCQRDVPMLDEEEFARIAPLHTQGIESIKAYREQHGVGLADVAVDEHFQALHEAYRQITGVDEPDHDEILRHRIALYGPPCETCGKPLRTPQARMCAACGANRGEVETPTNRPKHKVPWLAVASGLLIAILLYTHHSAGAMPQIGLFRSSDIIILISSGLNLLIGIYIFTVQPTPMKKRAGCALISFSAFYFCLAVLVIIMWLIWQNINDTLNNIKYP